MVVISDTSVISNLFQIGQVHLLKELFKRVILPPAVSEELLRMDSLQKFMLSDHAWLEERVPNDHVLLASLQVQLDPGESEAIVLAEELRADVLLIDEAKGRKIARKRNIPITGLLGVLLAAKNQKLIEAVTPLMDRLMKEVHFRISETLYLEVKMEADE